MSEIGTFFPLDVVGNKKTEMDVAAKCGVVVFILDPDNRVLIIRENTDKVSTGRKKGDFSVPCETQESGENWQDTLIRGLREELGVTSENPMSTLDFGPGKYLGTWFIDKSVWATVAVIRCSDPELFLRQARGSGEIDVIGWMNVENFERLNLRDGVRNILDKFKGDIFSDEKFGSN